MLEQGRVTHPPALFSEKDESLEAHIEAASSARRDDPCNSRKVETLAQSLEDEQMANTVLVNFGSVVSIGKNMLVEEGGTDDPNERGDERDSGMRNPVIEGQEPQQGVVYIV